jgi:hypothetical protein
VSSNDKRASTVQTEVSIEILNFIVNNKRDELSKLENETEINFKLIGNNQFRGKECKILSFDSKSNILGKSKNEKDRKPQNKKQKNSNSKSKNSSNSKTSSNKNTKNPNKKTEGKKNINKNNKKTSDKSISNENIKDKKQTKKTSDQNKKSKQTDEVRNENYIGAPVADSKKTKDKKTGWWNK